MQETYCNYATIHFGLFIKALSLGKDRVTKTMKKKLYYVLFPVYILVVLFVLYLNGVFTGQITDMTNLIINAVFLLVIGVLFLISISAFGRLEGCASELRETADRLKEEYKENGGRSLWSLYRDRKDTFRRGILNSAFNKYQMRMQSFYSKKGYMDSCDIDEFINEDLLDKAGKAYFNNGMAGMLTGLGILGTFLGLSIGLGSFNGNDIYAVTDNVGTLLGGMKVAFHTSVYGIFFSLVFGLVYRSLMSQAYEDLNYFLMTFRQCVKAPVVKEEENSVAMLVYQANMANTMKQILEILQTESDRQIDGLDRIVDAFTARMSEALNVNLTQLGENVRITGRNQQAFADKCKTLVESVEALTAEQEKNRDTLRRMQEYQEAFSEELKEQERSLADAVESMSTDISNQLFTFEQMRNEYEK